MYLKKKGHLKDQIDEWFSLLILVVISCVYTHAEMTGYYTPLRAASGFLGWCCNTGMGDVATGGLAGRVHRPVCTISATSCESILF